MIRLIPYVAAASLLLGGGGADNSTTTSDGDSCGLEPWPIGPWSAALEEWVTVPALHERHGRIMALPSSPGYYVTDRVDRPPPPPIPPRGYSEWADAPYEYKEPAAGSKIVNRPPPAYPHKDQFKPSQEYMPHPPPQGPYQHQHQQHQQQQHQQSKPPHRPAPPGGAAAAALDRVDPPPIAPPRRPVSDTDLYLLSAIEKLAYRADLMEKRLRRVEDGLHRLLAHADPKPEPCPVNFTRVGSRCYHVSATALDWKEASAACRRLRGSLLELHAPQERDTLVAHLLTDANVRGMDVWTGGLNPGLLWIWAHSARPVLPNQNNTANNATATASIAGEGRCLALVHDPALHNYVYRGQDCAFRHRYVCERDEERGRLALANEIERESRALLAAASAAAAAPAPAHHGRGWRTARVQAGGPDDVQH